MSRIKIDKVVERKLYAESMGRCMNPECQVELFINDGDMIEKAHIEAYCDKFPLPNHKENETEEEDNELMKNYLLYMDMLTSGYIACSKYWQELFRLWIKEVQTHIEKDMFVSKESLKELFSAPNTFFLNFKQPSKAMYKYRKAFMRNDAERYNDFIGKVSSGEVRLHADTLAPYELVEPYINDNNYTASFRSFMRQISEQEKNLLNATWASLPDFGSEENAIAVIDTSGSMYWDAKPMPAAVALSLGLYFAEHNTGLYKNHFIEFSARPQLIEIKGDTFADRLRYVASFNEVANTNLEAVFDLILNSAVENNVSASELPAKLIIISDMEFDRCVSNARSTNFKNAKAKFEAHGYNLPDIVFWNVASRNRQQPITKNERGVALVSGCTPRLFEMVASGTVNPYAFMLEVVESERYAKIVA